MCRCVDHIDVETLSRWNIVINWETGLSCTLTREMGEDLHFTGLIATCLFDKQPSKILALSLLHNKLSSTVYTAVVQISITTPWLGAHTQYYCILDFYLDDGLALLGECQLGLHFPGDMFPLGGFRHPRRGVRRQQTAPVTSCCGKETAGFRRGRAPALLPAPNTTQKTRLPSCAVWPGQCCLCSQRGGLVHWKLSLV